MKKNEEDNQTIEIAEKSSSNPNLKQSWKKTKQFFKNKYTKIALFVILNASIIGLIVYLFLKYDLFVQISNIRLSTILIYCVIFIGLMILKSFRYTLLLFDKLSLVISFFGVSLGFLINSLVPGRIGDVSRFVYLKTSVSEVSSGDYIGSLVVEKVIDLISLCLIALLLVLIFAVQFISNIMWIFLIAGIILVLIAFVVFLIIKYHKFFDRILTSFVSKFSEKAEVEVKLSESINNYFRKLIKSKIKVLINIALSLIIVVTDTLLIYLILHELLPQLTVAQGILAGSIGFLAVVFPILPGGLGTYQGSIVLTLGIFSYSEALTFAASTSELAIRTLIYIIIGVPVYLFVYIQRRRRKQKNKIVIETEQIEESN